MFRGALQPLVFAVGAIMLLAGMAPPARHYEPHHAVVLQELARAPDVLRFRVIANSDTPYDQAVKIAVRNGVLGVLDSHLVPVHDTRSALAVVDRELGAVRREVRAVLHQDHVRYGFTVHLRVSLFPTKAYGSWLLPAGRYHALVITLGRGRGHNWWCVLFPALCFIDLGSGLSLPEARTMVHQPRHWQVEWWVPPFLATWFRRL